MEKLLTKKDTKMVVKNLLDYLKKIIIASESIPNYEGELEDVIGDIEIDIANMVCPDKWIEVETGGKIKKNESFVTGLCSAYADGEYSFDEIWNIFVVVMNEGSFTKEEQEKISEIMEDYYGEVIDWKVINSYQQ